MLCATHSRWMQPFFFLIAWGAKHFANLPECCFGVCFSTLCCIRLLEFLGWLLILDRRLTSSEQWVIRVALGLAPTLQYPCALVLVLLLLLCWPLHTNASQAQMNNWAPRALLVVLRADNSRWKDQVQAERDHHGHCLHSLW